MHLSPVLQKLFCVLEGGRKGGREGGREDGWERRERRGKRVPGTVLLGFKKQNKIHWEPIQTITQSKQSLLLPMPNFQFGDFL